MHGLLFCEPPLPFPGFMTHTRCMYPTTTFSSLEYRHAKSTAYLLLKETFWVVCLYIFNAVHQLTFAIVANERFSTLSHRNLWIHTHTHTHTHTWIEKSKKILLPTLLLHQLLTFITTFNVKQSTDKQYVIFHSTYVHKFHTILSTLRKRNRKAMRCRTDHEMQKNR